MKKRIFLCLLALTLLIAGTLPVAATAAEDALNYDLGTEVHFFGRTYEKSGTYWFNWSASGFEVSFRGSGVKALIYSNAPGGTNTGYLKVYIDGVEQPDLALNNSRQSFTLASGLDPEKEHTVRVVKRTNARASSSGVKSITLLDGTKCPPPAQKEHLIEFIGDSLTVGYATLADRSVTAWSTATEDVTKCFCQQVADAFDADYRVVAISGRGIVRNTEGDTDKLLPAIYPYVDQYNNPGVPYDFENDRKPDVIVINLGTNDESSHNTGLSKRDFKQGLVAFLKEVRGHYPDAEILYTYGLTKTTLESTISETIQEFRDAGDAHISFLHLTTCSSSEIIISHPTAQAYISRGNQIIDALTKLGVLAEEETEPATEAGTEPVTEPTTEVVTAAETRAEEAEATGGCGSVVCTGAVLLSTLSVAFCVKKRKH